MALFDRIDGDHRTFENSQNFFESLNNSAKIFFKHCHVWKTFGQKHKIQSLLVFFAKKTRNPNRLSVFREKCKGVGGGSAEISNVRYDSGSKSRL